MAIHYVVVFGSQAVEKIKELAIKVKKDDVAGLRAVLERCAATTLSSKLLSANRDFFSKMAVDAVLLLDDLLPLDMIGIKKITGGNLEVKKRQNFSIRIFFGKEKIFAFFILLLFLSVIRLWKKTFGFSSVIRLGKLFWFLGVICLGQTFGFSSVVRLGKMFGLL